MTVLAVPTFGRGVVLEGSADARRTDELLEADSYEIGPRGQLVAASDNTGFGDLKTSALGNALTAIYGIYVQSIPQAPLLIGIGERLGNTYVSFILPDGTGIGGSTPAATHAAGYIATFAEFPFILNGVQLRLVLLNIGARAAFAPKTAPGMYAFIFDPGGPTYNLHPISDYDALGTGPGGEFHGGTLSGQLQPRGIVAYNDHAFYWGYAAAPTGDYDAPNRMGFSNSGNPLKWGFDPDAAAIEAGTAVETDRAFEDTDAILIGGPGAAIRDGYVWNGKLWVGTNQGLHYISGYGRESFLTNKSVPIRKSRNVVGPHCLIEGPDGLLYGCGDQGLWVTDGSAVDPIGNRLRDYDRKSTGWWDLIWTDPSRTLASDPGQTNQDRVWMAAYADTMEVWVVIPWCDATNGYGYGTDSVAIKYNVLTGGFTRQVFTGKTLAHGHSFPREHTAKEQRYIATPGSTNNVSRYAFKTTPASSPTMPVALPAVTFGEYAPFGPTGTGVMRKRYLVISWVAVGSLPLVFTLTPTIDGQAQTAVKLTIGASQPGAPSNGDLWVDTSGTDTSIGNGTAGSITPSNPADYILWRYVSMFTAWRRVPGGGQQGTRVTIPVAFDARVGTRIKLRAALVSAGGRYQIEGFDEDPSMTRPDV